MRFFTPAPETSALMPALRKTGPTLSPIPVWRGLPIFAKLWLLFPCRIRAAVYDLVEWYMSKFLPPRPRGSGCVRKLPFGLYVKASWGLKRAEAHAMHLVQQNTTLPLPKLLDYIVRKTPDHGDFIYILMTEIPGKMMSEVRESLTDEQLVRIGMELREAIQQLQQIPNPFPHAICSAAGDALDNPTLDRRRGVPPLKDVPAFHAWLTRKISPSLKPLAQELLQPVCATFDNTQPVFTHGDIAERNILIHEGKFSGLIDWETAGWMPVYWEYVSAMNYDWNLSDKFRRVVEVAMPGAYEHERKAIIALMKMENGILPSPKKGPKELDGGVAKTDSGEVPTG